jgi:hypothetical protein
MASWRVREKRARVVIVELREIRREYSVEQTAPPLAVEKRPAQGTLQWTALPRAMLQRALFALPELRSDLLVRAFFAPGRQL